MTDENNDPFRQRTSESGTTTPGSDSTKGGHAEEGEVGGQESQTDLGGKTGQIGNTGVGPDWMQDRPGKGADTESPTSDMPETESGTTPAG